MNTTETDLSIPGNTLVEREYSVAVTGDAFRWLIDFGNEDVLNKVSGRCTMSVFLPCHKLMCAV